jgi:hypothetical protein
MVVSAIGCRSSVLVLTTHVRSGCGSRRTSRELNVPGEVGLAGAAVIGIPLLVADK